ncbi:MAG TPA: citrate/2-methylcitrate synthase [Anaerolineales bacterium]|nr:citrate/2-methylcitrate synthase [Anaerolineales bacterium]
MTAPSPAFVKGLAGVVAAQTALSSVDGVNGVLTYRGINIHDLAGRATYEEVAYLLLHGSLPTAFQLAQFKKELAANRELPQPVLDLIKSTPKDAVPMDALRTAVSALAFYEKDVDDISIEATLRKGLRLTAQFPTVVAAIHRARNGQPIVAPDPNLSHAENFLYILHGEKQSQLKNDAMNLYLVLLADHSLNASTFTARVVASTNADLHAAVTAALGALKGNLHGGAAEATMNMLLEIGSNDKVDLFVDNAFETKRKIMGIGHRIYKSGDPRAKHLLEWARKMETVEGKGHSYVDMAVGVEKAVLRHRELYPNVDFFSAPMLYYIGIPVNLDTCVFAISRVAGWTAHVIEQFNDATLIRPAAQYIGPVDQTYTPVADRK